MGDRSRSVRVRARELADVEPFGDGDHPQLRVLLLADTGHPARVVADYIAAIEDLSHHEVTTFNPKGWSGDEVPDTADFDVIVIHYSLYILGSHYLPPRIEELIYDFPGLKVQIIQDEYRDIPEMTAKMRRLGIGVIISSLSVDNIERVYADVDADAYSNLPGALSTDLLDRRVPKIARRKVDVVYRAYTLRHVLGRHAQLKPWLVSMGRALGNDHGLRVDVSDRNEDRIYGEAWPDFIAGSRTTLGCEGGASIFDFGGVAAATEAYLAAHPEASFEEVYDAVLWRVDGDLTHRTITPRVFETIALRTAMVLVPGEYRGLLTAWEHYIPIEADGGNLAQVADAIRDTDLLDTMVDRTYEEVGRSRRISWPFMVERLDAVISKGAESTTISASPVRRPRAVLLCNIQHARGASVNLHAFALRDYSTMSVDLVSFHGDLPPEFDLDAYDVVLLHWSIAWGVDSWASPQTRRAIHHARGLKVAFVQDEYRWVDRTIAALRSMGVSVLFSCVPEREVEKVYPASRFPDLEVRQVLTGYVQPELLYRAVPDYRDRPIDVSYRGRELPFWLGELAQDKVEIGRGFLASLDEHNIDLATDIAWAEDDRLYGDDWIDFLASSRATLGVESGASVFDFSGGLKRDVEAHVAANPGTTFDDVQRRFLTRFEHRISLNQVSPRLFEAAALRTLLVLFEGDYSGIFEPWVHYVPLAPDFSNIRKVVEVIRDDEAAGAIVDAAYREIALEPRFRYEHLLRDVDEVVARHLGVSQ